jgi:hypothetical protein
MKVYIVMYVMDCVGGKMIIVTVFIYLGFTHTHSFILIYLFINKKKIINHNESLLLISYILLT